MSRKVKKSKNDENAKSSKLRKCKKWKSDKSENTKSDKKSVKKWGGSKKAKMSLKWPKSTLCEIRAAWSGRFSIPGGTTGPGFKAENRMGGVRRRILITFFCFSLFHFHHFVTFWHFTFSWFCHFLCFYHFCDFDDFDFFMIFDQFLLLTSFLVDFCVKFKCPNDDTLFT